MTSQRNLDFVKGLGFYDQVLTYDEIRSLPSEEKSVFVDMAGNAKVSQVIHEHFDNNLGASLRIGMTHWDAGGETDDLPGPTPEFFFAPSQIQKRIAEWGPNGFQERLGSSLQAFLESTKKWMRVRRGYGIDEVLSIYASTLEGSAAPEQGNIVSMWPSATAASGK